jgi:hypothetical protein
MGPGYKGNAKIYAFGRSAGIWAIFRCSVQVPTVCAGAGKSLNECPTSIAEPMQVTKYANHNQLHSWTCSMQPQIHLTNW